MTKILLKGFYGFGNLGDDILMLTTHKIIKEIFPQSEIIVASESKNPEYIRNYLPGIKIVNSTHNLKVDWIIHGGGGVFFDFTKHSLKYALLNTCIRLMGYSLYGQLYNAFRRLQRHGMVEQKARAGIGIGVGTYTLSSNRFFSDILALSTFDILLTRDSNSVDHAKKYCRSSNIIKSSDLAFLVDYWMPSGIVTSNNREAIGFILRDWVFNDNVTVMLSVAKALISKGHDVKFFAFDEDADQNFIKAAALLGQVYCWNPNNTSLEKYLSELKNCELVVSSRAHGVIVSACLGIPVCCVCIEPKLEQVARMLNNSARTINQPFNTEKIVGIVENTLVDLPRLRELTLQDVNRNNLEMSKGISLLKNFILANGHPNGKV